MKAKDGMNVNSWKLWDEDIEKFEHEIELYKKLGEEIYVSYTDEVILPDDATCNSGRRLKMAIVISTDETYRRLKYVMN